MHGSNLNFRKYTYSNMTLNASGCTSNIFMTVSVAANPPKNIASKTGEAMAKNIRWPLKIYKIHFLNLYPEKIIRLIFEIYTFHFIVRTLILGGKPTWNSQSVHKPVSKRCALRSVSFDFVICQSRFR